MEAKWIVAIVVAAVFVVMLIVTICTVNLYKAEQRDNEKLRMDMARLKAQLDNAQTMLELKSQSEREANEKKKKLAGGSGRDKFDNAVDVMRD